MTIIIGLPSLFSSEPCWERVENEAQMKRAVNNHYLIMMHFKKTEHYDEGWQMAHYLEDQETWFLGDAYWEGEIGKSNTQYDERPDPVEERDFYPEQAVDETWVKLR